MRDTHARHRFDKLRFASIVENGRAGMQELEDAIGNALRAALAPVHHLAVTDVTDGHAEEGVLDGRALRADGREILVLVVSAGFDGQTPIDRQRAVNAVLAEDLSTGKLHSVRMKCWTPSQWQRQGAPQSFPLAVHLASKCTKPAAASAAYSPMSVIMATPSTTTAMEEAPLRLPASAAQPVHVKPLHREEPLKKQDSLFVCEGGCGLALF